MGLLTEGADSSNVSTAAAAAAAAAVVAAAAAGVEGAMDVVDASFAIVSGAEQPVEKGLQSRPSRLPPEGGAADCLLSAS